MTLLESHPKITMRNSFNFRCAQDLTCEYWALSQCLESVISCLWALLEMQKFVARTRVSQGSSAAPFPLRKVLSPQVLLLNHQAVFLIAAIYGV